MLTCLPIVGSGTVLSLLAPANELSSLNTANHQAVEPWELALTAAWITAAGEIEGVWKKQIGPATAKGVPA